MPFSPYFRGRKNTTRIPCPRLRAFSLLPRTPLRRRPVRFPSSPGRLASGRRSARPRPLRLALRPCSHRGKVSARSASPRGPCGHPAAPTSTARNSYRTPRRSFRPHPSAKRPPLPTSKPSPLPGISSSPRPSPPLSRSTDFPSIGQTPAARAPPSVQYARHGPFLTSIQPIRKTLPRPLFASLQCNPNVSLSNGAATLPGCAARFARAHGRVCQLCHLRPRTATA